MTQAASSAGQIAPLQNIGLIETAISRLTNRAPGDPGLLVVSGPSGYGKTVAAAWAKARHRAYYVQLNDFLTKRSLLTTLARAMAIDLSGKLARATTADLAEMVAGQLHAANRVLILDEFDFAVEKQLVMAVFSLYESSRAAIILVGEERLPAQLNRWEKFSGRILDVLYAEPVSLEDARILARQKYPDIRFADDLLSHLVSLAKGSVRRVNNNLSRIHDEALSNGWACCDLAIWGARPLQMPDVKRRAG